MQMHKKRAYVLANFGGPRFLDEVEPFLKELLTDRDVVRTSLPSPIHNYLFKNIARKRARRVSEEYKHIGGGSPIFADTEGVAGLLREKLKSPVIAFHRYLPATHDTFVRSMAQLDCHEIHVFPLFPQFTYATTGSVARWFREKLPYSVVNKMRWIKSYADHPAFIRCHENSIREFLLNHGLEEREVLLFFTAHGIPQQFVMTGDLYRDECQHSFALVTQAFPNAAALLAYQSKFGPGEWLRPYTADVVKEIDRWNEGRSHIVFVPISFTSDHLETLSEIEKEYMTVVRQKGLHAYRVPALTLRGDWVEAIQVILNDTQRCLNQMLIRPT